jgi:hypothetical protein
VPARGRFMSRLAAAGTATYQPSWQVTFSRSSQTPRGAGLAGKELHGKVQQVGVRERRPQPASGAEPPANRPPAMTRPSARPGRCRSARRRPWTRRRPGSPATLFTVDEDAVARQRGSAGRLAGLDAGDQDLAIRVRNGKIVSEHTYFDRMLLAEQLGLNPPRQRLTQPEPALLGCVKLAFRQSDARPAPWIT